MNVRMGPMGARALALGEIESRYRRDGFAFPCRVLPENEAGRMARDFQTMMEAEPGSLRFMRTNPHLVFRAVDRLVRDERVLDAVERILGPDLLLWNTAFFVKPPRTTDHVSWHQDLTYWGFDGTDQVSAWLALSPATVDNGCMRFVPGSHRGPIEAHRDTFAADNQLTRGQTLAIDIEEAEVVPVTLAPGEMSLHHGRLFHASGPNHTDEWRIGITLIYLSPGMRQVVAARDHAQLVRGTDRFGHFERAPRPRFDLDPAAIAAWEEVADAVGAGAVPDGSRVRPVERCPAGRA